jgi:hypothetical protein
MFHVELKGRGQNMENRRQTTPLCPNSFVGQAHLRREIKRAVNRKNKEHRT